VTADSGTAVTPADSERAASNDIPPTASTKRWSEADSAVVCANARIDYAWLA